MTKTLLGNLREYKKGSILTILLSVLEAAFEILIPLRMADLIDQGIEPGEMAAVWKFGTIILVFAVLQLLTGVLSAGLLHERLTHRQMLGIGVGVAALACAAL